MIWKKCRRFPGYFINEMGDVFSLKSGKIMKPSVSNSGYLCLVLRVSGKYSSTFIHREISDAFISCVDGFDVNHINGNKRDNSLSNLEVVTRKQNIDHALITGLRKTKHSQETIRKIRKMYSDGYRQSEICKEIGLSKHLVFDVVRGRSRNVV